eukprot:TRINITY_DN639_c1_g1_i17.p2 TRINITY_DN639_c1_g1~~TRINITY_DN639_c1_g1_i17.p2  ORF type:complete len:198 (+),score=-13.96 TRINITY_DN639_c1_g1_i17:864-1457(+)
MVQYQKISLFPIDSPSDVLRTLKDQTIYLTQFKVNDPHNQATATWPSSMSSRNEYTTQKYCGFISFFYLIHFISALILCSKQLQANRLTFSDSFRIEQFVKSLKVMLYDQYMSSEASHLPIKGFSTRVDFNRGHTYPYCPHLACVLPVSFLPLLYFSPQSIKRRVEEGSQVQLQLDLTTGLEFSFVPLFVFFFLFRC